MAGISPSVITKMGKGEYISMENLVKICVALGVGLDDAVEITDISR